MARLPSIMERLENPKLSVVERLQREAFLDVLKSMNFRQANGLSVSCGDGIWDYLALSSPIGISAITATDVVNCPVNRLDIELLKASGKWDYVQVVPDSHLPFDNGTFDVCFSMDVIEHTRCPNLFLSDQHRVLRGGGGTFTNKSCMKNNLF